MYMPVKITRSYENIVEQIEEMISSGHVQIGDRLPGERDLAAQFQVSRVVVREAMRDLEARGIVRTRRGSGTYIHMVPSAALARSVTLLLKLDKTALVDIMLARKALEVVTADLAARNASVQHLVELQQCVDEMSAVYQKGLNEEEGFYAYSNLDTQLHLLIAKAARNAPIETLLSAILPLVKTGRYEVVKRYGSFESFRTRVGTYHRHHSDHTRLVRAIVERNSKGAAEAMDAHLTNTIRIYQEIGGGTAAQLESPEGARHVVGLALSTGATDKVAPD